MWSLIILLLPKWHGLGSRGFFLHVLEAFNEMTGEVKWPAGPWLDCSPKKCIWTLGHKYCLGRFLVYSEFCTLNISLTSDQQFGSIRDILDSVVHVFVDFHLPLSRIGKCAAALTVMQESLNFLITLIFSGKVIFKYQNFWLFGTNYDRFLTKIFIFVQIF